MTTEQCLEITAKVSSAGEAEALAEKHLRLHNKFSKKISFTFPGNTALVAAVTVQLKGWGAWDGKYLVKKADRTVGTSGYTTKIAGYQTAALMCRTMMNTMSWCGPVWTLTAALGPEEATSILLNR